MINSFPERSSDSRTPSNKLLHLTAYAVSIVGKVHTVGQSGQAVRGKRAGVIYNSTHGARTLHVFDKHGTDLWHPIIIKREATSQRRETTFA